MSELTNGRYEKGKNLRRRAKRFKGVLKVRGRNARLMRSLSEDRLHGGANPSFPASSSAVSRGPSNISNAAASHSGLCT